MIRAVLDSNVVYPTFLRMVLLDVAKSGCFAPVWSPRILLELEHVAEKDGPVTLAHMQGDIAVLNAFWPDALHPDVVDDFAFDLPDPADVHVLSLARAAQANFIVTANLKDFPSRVLNHTNIRAIHPDAFLCELPIAPVRAAVENALIQAKSAINIPTPRKIMAKAGLGRLSKRLEY